MRCTFGAIVAFGLVACKFDVSGLTFDDDAGAGGPDAADAAIPDGPLPLIDAMLSPDAPTSDALLPDASNVATTALMFDGMNDFVSVGRQVDGDFTIEAWINTTTSRAGSQHYHGLGVVHADVAGSANDFGTAILNGHYAFGTGNPDVTIESTTIVTIGSWVHVAATRDRSTGIIRVYINGIEEAMVDTTNTNNLSAASNIAIGGNTIDNRFFEGTMDEMRIWSSVRTGAELIASMNVQLIGNEAGLVNYWRFDDGSGMTAIDTTGTNDGNLGGGSAAEAPSWVASDAPIF